MVLLSILLYLLSCSTKYIKYVVIIITATVTTTNKIIIAYLKI